MLFLGIDPARSGAAVLLDGGPTVVAGFVWTPKVKAGAERFELVFAFRRGPDGRLDQGAPWWASRIASSTLGSVGERIRDLVREIGGGAPYALAGENAVIGRAVDTSISVARNAGRVLGPLEMLASGQATTWVRATEWRVLLLGLHHRATRDEAKEQSRLQMPTRIQGLAELIRLLGDADDLTDAAGVAEWLVLHTRDPSSVRASSRKRKPKPKPAESSRSGESSEKRQAAPAP